VTARQRFQHRLHRKGQHTMTTARHLAGSIDARPWSVAELDWLRRLAATGLPPVMIALKLQRPVVRVREAASREGIKLQPSSVKASGE
jgi:hypothetical protein